MKTILFVNACVRAEHSRTLRLARTYIKELEKSNTCRVIERNLCNEKLTYLTDDSFDLATGIQKPIADSLAKEFAEADEIIIAAPYWEFMFPAVLSCYFEAISLVDVTFRYGPTGSYGLCKADRLTYIYTAGNFLSEEDKINEIYIQHLMKLYGIRNFSAILADGLDIETNDAEQIVDLACKKITE